MATAENPPEEQFEDEVVETGQRMLMFNVIPSWMISFVGHVGLIILLAFLVLPKREEITTALEASATPGESIEVIDLDLTEFEESDTEELTEIEFEEVTPIEVETVADLETVDTLETEFTNTEEMLFDKSEFGDFGAVGGASNELGGRAAAGKTQALKKFGGTDASEEAVRLALKWIVDHQQYDGSWNFDHRIGPGDHRDSPNAGEFTKATNAATAIALLPLLGNGQTHKVGHYKENVRAGLEYLMANAKKRGRGISFYEKKEGEMYSHGLCAIVFCEAFAMTKDPKLAPFAQGSIWFMEDVQDPVGGGWRYELPERGDTSVVGWQVMALKSAKLSGLNINRRTWRLVDKFLNSVAETDGSSYGYTDPPRGRRGKKSQTSIGLLCRMYMGWKKDTPGLKRGVERLDDAGPERLKGKKTTVDMYYNYYATQVMKQYGGDAWTNWNPKMRDYLVNSQSKEGNKTGSWFFPSSDGANSSVKGGRLYNTALACMTLEVYYRYLPIYTDKSISDDFKLE